MPALDHTLREPPSRILEEAFGDVTELIVLTMVLQYTSHLFRSERLGLKRH